MTKFLNGHYGELFVLKNEDKEEDILEKILEELKTGQAEVKKLLKEGNEISDKNLKAIADELKQLTTIGVMPINIVEKMLDYNNKMNTDNVQNNYKWVGKFIFILLAVIAVLAGLKIIFPHIFQG